jgi:hypothetical protein
MSVEHAFDIPFIAALALKEKQIQAPRPVTDPLVCPFRWGLLR